MAENSKIEWTDCSWNPVSGCTHASAGCDNCYSVTMTHRLENMSQEKYAGLTVLNPRGERHFNGVVRCHDDALDIPLRWRKPRKIFVNSMSDLFHRDVPFEFIDKVFAVMALCPQHTFQVLTKRPERMAEYLATRTAIDDSAKVDRMPQWYQVATAMLDDGAASMPRGAWDRAHDNMPNPSKPLPNVWLGTSVENQAAADERIPQLLQCQAAVRFLSVEPLLGPIDFLRIPNTSPPHPNCPHGAPSRRIDWTIIGGESGAKARPYALEWASDIIAQCRAAGVPVFHKQCGSFPVTTNYNLHDFPDGTKHVAWGEYAAGARLKFKDPKGGDMEEWPVDLRVREFPK